MARTTTTPRKTVIPGENEELERLFNSYLAATKRSIEALRAGDVKGFIEEDAKAGQMLRRIKERRGITSRPGQTGRAPA